jgi:ATP-dependent RNA helicase DDX31/DBP7
MEDLTSGASLALNIVSTPAPTVVHKKKKNNKYEKRRKKAQKRKDLKNGVDSTTTPRKEQQQPKQTEKIHVEQLQSKKERNSGDDDQTEKIHVEETADKSDKPDGLGSIEKVIKNSLEQREDHPNDVEPNTVKDEHKKPSNRRNALPDDDEERAKYLAEFHARPLELDRRSGATVRKLVPTSKESSHLFTDTSEWSNFPLHERLVSTLQSSGFDLQRPTVIQTKSIPAFFQDKQLHNILIHSETGSGKTLAYLLPILQSLSVDKNNELRKVDRAQAGTRCIILCPTRELAVQTLQVAERLCSKSFNWLVPGCLFGEEKRKSEKARIRKGLPIVIATPGRLLDHLSRTESLLLALKGKLEWLVLDEADRLLDMGLGEQVKQIVQRIRANQPGSGRDGITWRSVLVSATVTQEVERMAEEVLLGGDRSWKRVRASTDDTTRTPKDDSQLTDSTPRQLAQFHMTVSAKLRLAALIAFLAQRVDKSERTVVFMSTCASVDFYHALLEAVSPILGNDDEEDATGIFGNQCSIFKLHGNVPHGERQHVLRRFTKDGGDKKHGAILLATDVAARGLNLPNVDWIVQYDPPSEVSDYVHRAGRVARAGKAGHSLIFLLPSESLFLDVLKHRGVNKLNALSLTSALNAAAIICKALTSQGFDRSSGGLGQSNNSSSRSGEAFCSEIQHTLEDCIVQEDIRAKAERKAAARQRRGSEKPEAVIGNLMELAQNAFLSHLRAYPTREKTVRQIFSAKALHLGHVARSFALREPPKKLGGKKRRSADTGADSRVHNNASMAFDFKSSEGSSPAKKAKRRSDTTPAMDHASSVRMAKATLLANATRLQNSGMGSL